MKVIEQLIQHFHSRGVLSRAEIDQLVRGGYIRFEDLYFDGEEDTEEQAAPQTTLLDEGQQDRLELLGEELEAEVLGRRPGKKKGGKSKEKSKASGHDLAPLAIVLASHLAERKAYSGLLEVGNRLAMCSDWPAAAEAIGAAKSAQLEAALVASFNARPPVLGELWFWCEVSPLFEWAEHEDNSGAVADALASLLVAEVPTQVGRLNQLRKLPEVEQLLALLGARRAFLGQLRTLYEHHFDRLKLWLINPDPTGPAGQVWPAIPWAFVIQYNAVTANPTGYGVQMNRLSENQIQLSCELAWRLVGQDLLRLLPKLSLHPQRANGGVVINPGTQFVCPYEWAI